jgi:hypothetical protein
MLISFTPKSEFDGNPMLFYTSQVYDIYTEEEEYIQHDYFSFSLEGELQYYSIGEQKIYDATPPVHIRDEIEKKMHSRFGWKKQAIVFYTILPRGDINIQVKEAENYDEDIILYESTYQAQSYPLNFLSEQLQQHSPVPIVEWAELLIEQYFWTLDCQSPKKIEKLKVESVIYDYFSDNALSGSGKYEGTLKLLPYRIWTDNQQIILDMENVRAAFSQVYGDGSPFELSQIHVTFNDSLEIESLYLKKDGYEVALKYTEKRR